MGRSVTTACRSADVRRSPSLAGHLEEQILLGRRGGQEAVLEERQVQLMEKCRLDPLEVGQPDVIEADPAAGKGTEELEEIGVAGGVVDDLVDE